VNLVFLFQNTCIFAATSWKSHKSGRKYPISKHSKTALVNLSLQKSDDAIELIIQDRGQGFELDAVLSLKSYEKGLSLSGMRERTHLSGGSFWIESTKGIGTTIRASWPLLENR